MVFDELETTTNGVLFVVCGQSCRDWSEDKDGRRERRKKLHEETSRMQQKQLFLKQLGFEERQGCESAMRAEALI